MSYTGWPTKHVLFRLCFLLILGFIHDFENSVSTANKEFCGKNMNVCDSFTGTHLTTDNIEISVNVVKT